MKNIKAIIFDAYGTLFDVNSAAEKCKDCWMTVGVSRPMPLSQAS